jgi:hypothetical protein
VDSYVFEQAATIALTLYVPLGLGYGLRKTGLLGTEWTRPLMAWLMILVEPPITMYSLWVLRSDDVAVGRSFLGGVGSVILAAALITTGMMFVGRLASEPFGHNRKTRGAFIASVMFSNNGFTLGVFVCLLFLGIRGQSVGILYATYFLPYFVTVGFTLGRRYGRSKKRSALQRVWALVSEPLSFLPLSGFAAGLLLHEIAPRPPGWILPINKVVVRAEVATYAFAIGCTLSLGSIRRYWRECATVCGMKFLITPVVGIGVVYLLRSFGVLSGEPLVGKVILIQNFMPAAIMSVVLAKLFHLNEDLASASWVVSTLACALVLPLVYLLVA